MTDRERLILERYGLTEDDFKPKTESNDEDRLNALEAENRELREAIETLISGVTK